MPVIQNWSTPMYLIFNTLGDVNTNPSEHLEVR